MRCKSTSYNSITTIKETSIAKKFSIVDRQSILKIYLFKLLKQELVCIKLDKRIEDAVQKEDYLLDSLTREIKIFFSFIRWHKCFLMTFY